MRSIRVALSFVAALAALPSASFAASPEDDLEMVPAMLAGVQMAHAGSDEERVPKLASDELTVLYLTGLTRGHLIAAMALANHGIYDEAVLHSRHPLDEMLLDLSRLVDEDKVRSLRLRFEPFNEAVALKSKMSDLQELYEPLEAELDAIDAHVKTTMVPPTDEMLNLVVLWLKQAAEEYDEAWSGDRLVNVVEYQDGFGFLSVARAALDAMRDDLDRRDVAAATTIVNALDKLQSAWPSVIAPRKPKITRAMLRAQIAIAEINARRFAR